MTTEAQTRLEAIDLQLAKSGWSPTSPSVVKEYRIESKEADPAHHNALYADYVLLGNDGIPLAVIEAKRTSRDALAGKAQAKEYADRIHASTGFLPFIFLANGRDIWFWDSGRYPPEQVSGFFSPNDLTDRLAFQRRYAQSLVEAKPNHMIADRPYQIEAIRRVTEALEASHRKLLLVMATGTGKTRTVIALIDLLMQSKWIQRVLFLADRRELVRQALGDFKAYMPDVSRSRVESGILDDDARIHVATYPSMMQVYRNLSPGYFDLIVADESHRSIYNRYKDLFDYFYAIQIGLTATPTDYIDHNTFELFNCEDGLPTFYYSYDEAVNEGYLADYRVLEAQTQFQLEGIKAGQLPPELQKQLVEQGIELSDINFEGTDLERRVTNVGTTDAIVREFLNKCRKDTTGKPIKSIIFAMSHQHAVEIWKSFNRLEPQWQRLGLAEIIDSHMERADKLLGDFKRKSMPRVAISVDMLDTGIDIPSLENLVFAKPVFSQVKFWQMIGRGTRLYTDPETGREKKDFLIIDFWSNFAYFNMNPEGEVASLSEPLPVRLFRLRLEKLFLLRGINRHSEAGEVRKQLQQMLADLPQDNLNVSPHLPEIRELTNASDWNDIDEDRASHLTRSIAPLCRYLPDVHPRIMGFEVRTERLAIVHLTGQDNIIDSYREQIVSDLNRLPKGLEEVQSEAENLKWMTSDGFWDYLDYDRIMALQATFAPLMRFRMREQQSIVRLNLPDRISTRRWIIYGPSGEGAFADSYRKQVEAYVKGLAEQAPALHKLKRGDALNDRDLSEIAAILNRPDLFITEQVLQDVYERDDAGLADFLRHILDIEKLESWEERVRVAFDNYIEEHPAFTATQLNFLRTIRTAILKRVQLTVRDLERPPFSRVGEVHKLFSDDELAEILAFANQLAA